MFCFIPVLNALPQYCYESTNLPTHDYISDAFFANSNTGWIIGRNNNACVFKTTDKGLNWSVYNLNYDYSFDDNQSISFINANTGWAFFQNAYPTYNTYVLNKTTNGGLNWNLISYTPGFRGKMRFATENIGYFITDNAKLFKTSNGGINWTQIYQTPDNNNSPRYIDIGLSKTNSQIIYINGITYTGDDEQNYIYKTILIKSTNAGESFSVILDGNNIPSGYEGGPSHFSVLNNNGTDLVRFTLGTGLFRLNTDNTLYKISNFSNGGILTFYNENNGFTSGANFTYHTTDGGISWIQESNNLPSLAQIYISSQCNDIYYISGYNLNFYIRTLGTNMSVYEDNSSVAGTIQFDGQTKSVALGGTQYYLRGGTSHLYIDPQSSLTNKIFYKWNDGSLLNDNLYYYFDSPGVLASYFKTKMNSTSQDAISNSTSTKSLIDTNGIVNQVHESMGGIFYSRSTDNGVNYSKEEVVNFGKEYIEEHPTVKTGNQNSFPAICELRNLMQLNNPFPVNDGNVNIGAVWQRYNSETQKIEIKAASRVFNNYQYIWRNYGTTGTYINNDGKITDFSVNSEDYKSKPTIFASWLGGGYDKGSLYDYLVLIPHLEPSTNGGNKFVITAKCRNYPSYDNINPPGTSNNFIIEDGNVTDYAITSIPTRNNNIYNGYKLFITYIKNNTVYYRADLITLSYGYSGYVITRSSYQGLEDISTNIDGNQIERISPDISLRNGLPVIAYRGKTLNLRSVSVVGGEEDLLISVIDYPILVKYRYNTESGEAWSTTAKYSSAGAVQSNPNVEGNYNFNSYLLNYWRGGKYKLIHSGGSCVPNELSVFNVKFVKGTFSGSTFPNYSPVLFKSTQSGSLYNLQTESFTVRNTHDLSVLDNLVGIIREQNQNYNFNLGPVIVKNTNVSFPNETETSITNSIEFNNNMVSAPFSLGPNDTLILDGSGYYNLTDGEIFTQKRFTVNLMRKSSQGIFLTLFSDSIGVNDTVQSEYLRGIVFDEGMVPQVDSFYVQLILDSTSLNPGDGEYQICNVYSPDEIYEGDGDNSHSYKRFVHFGDGKINNANLTPKTYSISQNYPNPFNPVTNIKYQIPENSFVSVKIYDLTGREIAKLVNEYKQAGYYTVSFNGSNFASGVYFYRIQAGNFTQVKKMVLIK